MTKPLITVIIPTHNNAETIVEALSSIQTQTHDNLEIIVVDDGSTDNTKEVVEGIVKTDSRVHYYPLEWKDPYPRTNSQGRNINAGYLARNFGISKSKGEYITFQDADDTSLVNRIEMELSLLTSHDADHVCIDWQSFEPKLTGKQFDYERFSKEHPIKIVKPHEIYTMATKAKGVFYKLFPSLGKYIPWSIKTSRFINKLFFGNLDPYPGSGNCPLFKRQVVDKCLFRPLPKRIWPSFTGRGADRDFNFQVAETFKNSYTFFVPAYLWRMNIKNPLYPTTIDTYTK